MIRSRLPVIMFACLLTALMSCNQTRSQEESEADAQVAEKEMFYGQITYISHIKSGDSALINSLRTFSPERVDVFMQKDTFRMIEYGGLSHGNILIFTAKKEAWQLDSAKKIAYLGEYSDLGDPSAALKDLMPDHYAPTVEKTDITEVIAGIPCTKYRITRSGMIPKDDTAYIWAADKLKFPSSRFDVQTEINHAAAPPPLFIGYEDGAVMRLQVINKKYERTFEVTSLQPNTFPEGIFEIPAEYQKK